ncbi:N-acetylmuramoyl-L-alanine amidase [Peptostreptococcaceae bacterium pGA-8]|nr:N-acetylmuramoyl-L-alanine amidase [Peptostreptococcaceae bacterium pGA-8]
MAYEFITTHDSLNFGYPRGTKGQNKPKEIIIHHWGADGASFWGVVNWLCRKGGGSSAHLVVEAGRVACLVDYANAAWHAGDGSVNMHSIGIECRPEMSDGDMQTVAEVIADIWKTYGRLPLRGHKDVQPTACPGRWYAQLKKLEKMAEQYMTNSKPTIAPSKPAQPTTGKSIETLAREVLAGNWGNGDDRKANLESAGYNYYAVQARVNELCGVQATTPTPASKSVDELAREVLNGDWGVGSDRAARLAQAGYNYQAVQARVNDLCGVTSVSPGKSLDEVAREVIRGDWGNGQDRFNRLAQAGYNVQAVQARVNQLLA